MKKQDKEFEVYKIPDRTVGPLSEEYLFTRAVYIRRYGTPRGERTTYDGRSGIAWPIPSLIRAEMVYVTAPARNDTHCWLADGGDRVYTLPSSWLFPEPAPYTAPSGSRYSTRHRHERATRAINFVLGP